MSKSKKMIITISGDRSMHEIKKELTDNGFAVDQVFESAGSITGEFSDDKVLDKLKSIRGVTDVSPEPPPIDIGPPGSPITW
jgi:hypothetical protein